jgi:23S rRNA (uracil1939-C5)-methyltransferase
VAGARCRHFGTCGGCDWQDVAYGEQLGRKRDLVTRLLTGALGAHAPRVDAVAAMSVGEGDEMPWGFRRKAAFVFAPKPGVRSGRRSPPFVLGHYARRSREVVPIVECPVHAPRANRIAFALAAELARAGVPAAGTGLDGVLRHVIVRTTAGDREAMAMLVVTRNDRALRRPIRAFLAGAEKPTGFFLNVHDRPGPGMIGPETMHLDGRGQVREQVGRWSFLLSPTAFFQTNPSAAATLIEIVTEAAGTTPLRVLDLYAGSGLFALPLASVGHSVTAVEAGRAAVEDGRRNVALHRLPAGAVRFIAAPVEQALPRLRRDRFDLVVLDPPREGCSPAVLAGVFEDLAPPRAVYVSCDPTALARDLAAIVRAGYRVRRVQPVDMFPHTTHVETVVTVARG